MTPKVRLPGVEWIVRKTGNRLIATAPDLAVEPRISSNGDTWLRPQFIAGMRFYVSFRRRVSRDSNVLKNSNDN